MTCNFLVGGYECNLDGLRPEQFMMRVVISIINDINFNITSSAFFFSFSNISILFLHDDKE